MRQSVAMATYNGAAHIRQQLVSILVQPTPVDEIVLADDASDDATLTIAETTTADWQASGRATPGFVVLRSPRQRGVVTNFERAMRGTSGDVILLSDQDDVWRPCRVERVAAAFHDRPEVLMINPMRASST